ncbi:MAG: glutamate-1-semialdehyde 2,1-aminomutase [Chitinophagaceae bacterium]|nr:glutamate-1-semialdehyde 2,1-aminomutase [Oligoflexus sp.]
MKKLSFERSEKLYAKAVTLMPGGVNSPVRAFKQVDATPIFIERAEGAYMWDADGNKFIDYIGSWGPAMLGHAHPEVVAAVTAALKNGFSFGAPSALEIQIAELIQKILPSMEMVRLVSSGTEACMAALRLARGFTGRDKILKFTGCYHGHADMLLVKAGSGVATLGIPGSPGVPSAVVKDTLTLAFNDAEGLKELFARHGHELAAVIVEPIVGNGNFIRPKGGYLELMRELCTQSGAILIFDEVMTGFRVGLSGVQGLKNIKPDLSTLGKVIGGGMPIGAYGGRRDIMDMVAPSGPVYQAGTLSGNPVAVTCGIKTLELLSTKYDFTELAKRTRRLSYGLKERAEKHGIPLSVDFEGGMFGFMFSPRLPESFEEAVQCNISQFKQFFRGMLSFGVYLAPSAFEAGFISFAHSDKDIEDTLNVADYVFANLSQF